MENEEKNPFVITDGVNLDAIGGKQKRNEKVMGFLIEALLALPIDKNKSIFLGLDRFGRHTVATGSVKDAQKRISEKYPHLKEITFTSRQMTKEVAKEGGGGVQKEYTGTRVWRIN